MDLVVLGLPGDGGEKKVRGHLAHLVKGEHHRGEGWPLVPREGAIVEPGEGDIAWAFESMRAEGVKGAHGEIVARAQQCIETVSRIEEIGDLPVALVLMPGACCPDEFGTDGQAPSKVKVGRGAYWPELDWVRS